MERAGSVSEGMLFVVSLFDQRNGTPSLLPMELLLWETGAWNWNPVRALQVYKKWSPDRSTKKNAGINSF